MEVAVTVQGVTLSQIHPVLDGKNRPMFEPTAFDVNTRSSVAWSRPSRCTGWACTSTPVRTCRRARKPKPAPTAPKAPVTPISGPRITPAQLRYIERLIDETGSDLGKVLDYFGVNALGRAQQPRREPRHHLAGEEPEGRMSTIMKLVQGSAEWHEHRRQYRNASETPAVLGVSPWMTPYQLWQIKLGLAEPEVTPAMLHGTQLEPQARAAYEALTGHVMQPLVLVDGEYSASLDGITLGGERVLEIKCPFKGRDSTLWKAGGGSSARALPAGRSSTS